MKRRIFISGILLFSICVLLNAKTRYISPNNDGVQDELEIPLQITDKRYVQAWSLVIMDSSKKIVRTIENKVALPTNLTVSSFFKQLVTPKEGVVVPDVVTWNGAMNNGETAPDGIYYYYITATDDNGNVGKTKEYELVIDTVAPDVDLVQPKDKIFGEGEKSSIKINQTGSVEDEWNGVIKNADGTVIKTYSWKNSEPMTFSWNGLDDNNAQVPDGVYSYEITSTDKGGNVSPYTSIQNIIYSADKPNTNIYVNGNRYFSPKTQSVYQTVTFDVWIPLPAAKTGNKLTNWEITIQDSKGKTVRTYSGLNGENPPSQIVFDGLDDNGKLLADGEYKAFVSAAYLNGYIPTVISSSVVVLDTKKPEVQIKASEKVFGAGSKDSVKFTIMIAPSVGAPVPQWKGEIVSKDGENIVKSYDFGEYPPESITWNGLDDKGNISKKDDYIFRIKGTDKAGNEGGGVLSTPVSFDTTKAQLFLAMTDSVFSPNNDKVKDTIVFTPVAQSSDVTSYEFVIKANDGTVVYSEKENKTLPLKFVWNGKDKDNVLCNDGMYFATLSVVAANGSSAVALTSPFEIDTVKPNLNAEIPWKYFSPDGDGNQDTIPVMIKDCTSEKLWSAEIRDDKNSVVQKITWSGTKTGFEWNGCDESGNIVKDGKYKIVIYSTDDAGNSFETEITGICLDNRVTKVYITAEYEGISPNNDNTVDVQEFLIKTTVSDDISEWNFDVRKEDGTSVYSLSQKDSAVLPSSIKWNGTDKDGNVAEGTFTGTIKITYLKGNVVNAVSSPFICTATPPVLSVQTAPKYFSPDNDGTDDDLFIKLSGATKAKIKNWSFEIKDPTGKPFWKTSGKAQITERLIWDGLSNIQKDSNGNAERVQSAMDYPYSFTVTDTLGMTSTVEGVIPVDVLVIRDGNLLKMAVPSIIFLSNESEFQKIGGNITKEQVDKNIQILNRIADILKKFGDYKVNIVGHANRLSDNVDEETIDNPKNWGRALMPLSKERAEAIKAYLVKKGVSAGNLSTEGMGGTKPVVNPKDKDNNWKNRRVEFILMK